jgi:hypothetical protein
MRRFQTVLFLAAFVIKPVTAQEKLPSTWDGPLLKPVEREAVYEFSREPMVKRATPDRYEISFGCKGNCDVAVAIEDASGRIVRHMVYGVLGSNAPAPLQKDSRLQTLFWDGKDEFGKYVRSPGTCRVRVSLGLQPTFDKLIGWHPKDMTEARDICALAATADGVFVLECPPFGHPTLRRYDHDANYVQMILPWDPDKLDRVLIPKRTLPDARIWRDKPPPAGSRHVPVLNGYATTEPLRDVTNHVPTCMAAAAGKIGICTDGYGAPRRLLRLRTDGTTGGESIFGGLFTSPNMPTPSFTGQAHIALSPDGKWVYVTGLGQAGYGNKHDIGKEKPPYAWNAVYRFPWDETGVVIAGRDSLIGEVSRNAKTAGTGNDNEHLNGPQGLACDSAGRLYVADFGNNRIQVFSPDGKYLKTIPVKEPQEITVHPKTGEIYVLCFRDRNMFGGVNNKETLTLIKFGTLDNPTRQMEQTFPAVIPGDPRDFGTLVPLLAVDGWFAETRIWLVHESGVVRVYAERGKKWELFDDFEADVRKAGHTPFSMHSKKMGYINVDPVRGHVYRISTRTQRKRRIDPEEGKTWQVLDVGRLSQGIVEAGGGVEEAVFGWDGLMYLRTLKYVARFNPDKFPVTGPFVVDADSELPFDYGQQLYTFNRKGEDAAKLQGVIAMPWAQGGPNGYNNGLAVSTRGDVLMLTENYQDMALEWAQSSKRGSSEARGGVGATLFRLQDDQKGEQFRPALYPGRISNSNLICRWDSKGRLVDRDALPGLPLGTFGLRTDMADNPILGVGYNQNVDGQPHLGGCLAKFTARGARLYGERGGTVKWDDFPERPADFFGNGRVWAKNMFWSVPGLDQMSLGDGHPLAGHYGCGCFHCRFDTDPYGRTFMPRAYAYHVQVVDSNGNRVCEIGRYGNADKPAMKPGDTDIGFGLCSYLATVSDKWLYIADDANVRIVRIKLGYQTEKRVTIPEQ